MSSEKNHFKLHLLIIFIIGLLINACEDNPQQFKLGEDFIDSQTQLNVIDTFSVKLSTVLFDTIVTSNTGRILVGNYQDNTFGKIVSNSYFQVGKPDSFDVQEDDIFDSLKLVLTYDSYSYGDTTKYQEISAYQLTENIELNDKNNITSQTTFSYNSRSLGSVSFLPKPNSENDTLSIKIHDAVGQDLFTKLKEKSFVFDNNSTFVNYFHGLVLMASDTYEGSIIGFKASAASTKIIMYTTRGSVNKQTICYEFNLENVAKQFNNISHDYSLTQLQNLTDQKEELLSNEAGGLAFLHGGIGLAIRVDFPSFSEFLLRERGTIVEAELSIAPQPGTYNEFDLPTGLFPYNTDKFNRKNDFILTNQGTIASSKLTIDNQYHENTLYTFDVTKYLIDELADSYVNSDNGILISLSSDNMASQLNRLIVNENDRNTKLKIYYLTY